MGRRWRYPHTTRTMACLGTHARSTKDQARSMSDGIPQSMSLRFVHEYILTLYSFSSPGHNALVSIHSLSIIQMGLMAGAVKATQCKRILLQVRY